MRRLKEFSQAIKRFLNGADLVLLGLCLAACAIGVVLISSATATLKGGSSRYITVQLAAICLGIVVYIFMTYLDIEGFMRHWKWLFAGSVLLILLLLVWGEAGNSGNKSWLFIPGFPTGIQPAEMVKVAFIMLMAKHMYQLRDRINHVWSMAQMLAHLLFFVGLIVVISDDMGVALTYVFIFFVMAVASNIKLRWFAVAAVALVAAVPLVWNFLLRSDQQERIRIFLNPEADPQGAGYQAIQSKIALGAGQVSGQGLYSGLQTQMNHLPAKQTDFIFSVAGEELGFIGCMVILVLLVLIILRCLQISVRAKSPMSMLCCVGVAGMLMFQVFENVGMCVGLLPIIGITLPFISSGGSSILTLFFAMGLVSSAKMHPQPSWLKDRVQ